jgi:hypothetical protein
MAAAPSSSFDVVLEIPQLDGFVLRAGTRVELTALDTPTPRLTLGPVVLHGQHQDVLGTVLAAGRAAPSAPNAVAVHALASKRVVFTVVSGQVSDIADAGS